MGESEIDHPHRSPVRALLVDRGPGQLVERLAQLDRRGQVAFGHGLLHLKTGSREPLGKPVRRVEPLDDRGAAPSSERGNEIQPRRAVVKAVIRRVHNAECNDLTRYESACNL